jgi:ElaB/YqjD/DUF883 family membrane-anchored ribosome-binding protein
MKIRNIFLALFIAMLGASFTACSKSDENKGALEKAGKSADEALSKAKEKTGEAMEKTGESIKEAGEKLKQSAKKASE